MDVQLELELYSVVPLTDLQKKNTKKPHMKHLIKLNPSWQDDRHASMLKWNCLPDIPPCKNLREIYTDQNEMYKIVSNIHFITNVLVYFSTYVSETHYRHLTNGNINSQIKVNYYIKKTFVFYFPTKNHILHSALWEGCGTGAGQRSSLV